MHCSPSFSLISYKRNHVLNENHLRGKNKAFGFVDQALILVNMSRLGSVNPVDLLKRQPLHLQTSPFMTLSPPSPACLSWPVCFSLRTRLRAKHIWKCFGHILRDLGIFQHVLWVIKETEWALSHIFKLNKHGTLLNLLLGGVLILFFWKMRANERTVLLQNGN